MDDFLKNKIEEFKRRNKEKREAELMQPMPLEPPKPVIPVVKLFNVHKRSLPTGVDKIVLFSVTKEEGEWLCEKVLLAKSYQNAYSDSKTLIYYDLIPIDAKPQEKSVYYNIPTITKDEPPLRIN